MNIVQICVAVPREIRFEGKTSLTGIFKKPVDGEVLADYLNLQGDAQADLSVHGGRDKALYVYSLDYYPEWAEKLGRKKLDDAQFG